MADLPSVVDAQSRELPGDVSAGLAAIAIEVSRRVWAAQAIAIRHIRLAFDAEGLNLRAQADAWGSYANSLGISRRLEPVDDASRARSRSPIQAKVSLDCVRFRFGLWPHCLWAKSMWDIIRAYVSSLLFGRRGPSVHPGLPPFDFVFPIKIFWSIASFYRLLFGRRCVDDIPQILPVNN